MKCPFREKTKHKVPLQRVYIIFSAVMAALVLAAFLVQLRVTQKIMYTQKPPQKNLRLASSFTIRSPDALNHRTMTLSCTG